MWLALVYFVFEGKSQIQAPGGLIFGGAYYRRVFAFRIWGAYIWRGLFSEFYGSFIATQAPRLRQLIFCGLARLESYSCRVIYQACATNLKTREPRSPCTYTIVHITKHFVRKLHCKPRIAKHHGSNWMAFTLNIKWRLIRAFREHKHICATLPGTMPLVR